MRSFASIFVTIFSLGFASASFAVAPVPVKKTVAQAIATVAPAPARVPAMASHGDHHEIDAALNVTGQTRNLSMGLLFQKDKDKLSFGTPRTNYKDKVASKLTNY